MNTPTPTIRILYAVGVFLFVMGAKLWAIGEAGSSLPYQDQIDAEGESILRPWLEDRLEWREFFAPHNEHRIVFTKLIALGIVAMNGQWDAYIQVIISAFIHAGLLLVLLNWLFRNIAGWRFHVIGLVSILLWTVPFDWENTLQGFQSQVYLVLTFSALQLIWVLGAERLDWRWWAGQFCGFFALGAMGGGSISSAAILGVMLVRWWTAGEKTRFHIVTAAVSSGWLLLGLLTRAPVPGHEILRAENLSEVMLSLKLVASWPLSSEVPFGFLFALPAIWMAIGLLRKKQIDGFEKTLVGIVIWTALTAFATAIFRGQTSPLISRYLTAYSLLIIVQGLAWAKIRNLRWSGVGVVVWGAVVIVSLGTSLDRLWNLKLNPRSQLMAQNERIVREYMGSNNITVLSKAETRFLPYPSAIALDERWKHKSIQSVMPAAVRSPLLEPHADISHYKLPPTDLLVAAASPGAAQTSSWTWRSEPQLEDSAQFIRFKFTGGLGDPETALHLRLVSNDDSINIIPDGSARNRWRTINVFKPAGKWWIEIEDNDNLDHLAITSPVELGVISWVAEKTIKYHFWWSGLGLFLVVMASLAKQSPSAVSVSAGRAAD